jgi:hypothetical protein
MNRLQKFVERGAYGEGPGRTAYILDIRNLPSAAQGMDWQKVDSFSAADEVFDNQSLKAVFKQAIDKGCAVVAAKGE